MSKRKLLKRLGDAAYRQAPEILLGLGIVGLVSTVVIAVRATPKAMELMEEAKKEKGVEELDAFDKAKATWKCYMPAAVTGLSSIACLLLSNSTKSSRYAALSAACSLSETAFKEYREKNAEIIGEKKEQAVRDAVNADLIAKHPMGPQNVIVTNRGNTLCYDPWSDRYFYHDVERLKRAALKISQWMLDDIYATLNDYYREIGLRETKIGDEIGWNVNRGGLLELRLSAQLYDEETPCIVLDYVQPPKSDFQR